MSSEAVDATEADMTSHTCVSGKMAVETGVKRRQGEGVVLVLVHVVATHDERHVQRVERGRGRAQHSGLLSHHLDLCVSSPDTPNLSETNKNDTQKTQAIHEKNDDRSLSFFNLMIFFYPGT